MFDTGLLLVKSLGSRDGFFRRGRVTLSEWPNRLLSIVKNFKVGASQSDRPGLATLISQQGQELSSYQQVGKVLRKGRRVFHGGVNVYLPHP